MYASPHRTLYLVAYDIADPRRLYRVHHTLLGWKVGGQKSFYECWLTTAELDTLIRELAQLIEPAEDRVHIFQLDPRMQPKCYGIARAPGSQAFIIV